MINRIGTTKRWSDAVVYNETIYLVEVPDNLKGSVTEQTKNVLDLVEKTLAANKSSKEHLLMVTIYLSDINTIDEFNSVWDEWIPEGTAPVRACVEAKLANPDYTVELQIVAALAEKNVKNINFMT